MRLLIFADTHGYPDTMLASIAQREKETNAVFFLGDVGTLWREAKSRGADVALFGHTHTALNEEYQGIHLFNPGSLSMPRCGNPSYGVITIQDGTPVFEICELE